MTPIREYGDLIEALRARRKALGISQLELDDRAGLSDGYTAKLEAWRNRRIGKGLGPVSLPLILEALGIGIVFVDIPETEPAIENVVPLRASLAARRVLPAD